jgi:hypothetical protein
MNNINLVLADINNTEDQNFLYDIIKFRWKYHDIINIPIRTSKKMPTFEEHLKFLKSNKYKFIYKIHLFDNLIGMFYLDQDYITGIFILPTLLKKAIKKIGNKNIIKYDTLAAMVYLEAARLHPEVEVCYAKINPKNKLSLNSLLNVGLEPIEMTFCLKTKNGKPIFGKWNHLN